jgi:hypothetical protein
MESAMKNPVARGMGHHTHAIVLALAVLGLAIPKSVHAGPILTDVWYEFSFGAPGTSAHGCAPADPAGFGCVPSSGTPTTFADAPPWTFAVGAAGATLTVTDAFSSGDQFELLDFGIPIGFTSIPGAAIDCGDDPVPCLTDPDMSHGFFAMAAGGHSITSAPSAGGFGSAYFIIDSAVPEPITLVLLGTGTTAALWRRRLALRESRYFRES